MRESGTKLSSIATAKRGIQLPSGAMDCTANAAAMARGKWPQKTAENWAAEADVKPRMAKYWLAGKHKVSAAGRLALIRLIS